MNFVFVWLPRRGNTHINTSNLLIHNIFNFSQGGFNIFWEQGRSRNRGGGGKGPGRQWELLLLKIYLHIDIHTYYILHIGIVKIIVLNPHLNFFLWYLIFLVLLVKLRNKSFKVFSNNEVEAPPPFCALDASPVAFSRQFYVSVNLCMLARSTGGGGGSTSI